MWPWHRRRPDDGEDLEDAHKQADRAIRDAQQLRYRADEVVGDLSKTRERNHFAAAVARAIRGT
jgi:hypothetical protein